MTGVVAYRLNELAAGVAINVRPGQDDVADLVASIRAHGLLQPLVGRKRDDDKIEIIDGNRRLAALNQIDTEDDAADVTTIEWVDVVLRDPEPDADAFEISLAANILRKPLHPVAEYEAFVQLAERGKTNDDIAAHFGITLRQVEQRQALGRLHPDVRKAWLEGAINGDAARAFTLVEPDAQAAYLAKATQSWELRWDSIRRAFTRESVPGNSPMALFIGEEAYVAAGGELVADLFAEKRDFADNALLLRLAADKLKAEAQRVATEEGWAEGLTEQEAEGRHSWDRIPKPALRDEDKPARIREIEERLRTVHARRLEIDPLLEAAWETCATEEDLSGEARALQNEDDRLSAEIETLETEQEAFDDGAAAWLTVPAETRAKAVIVVQINGDGGLDIARGYLKNKKPAPAPKQTAMAAPRPQPSPAGEETEAAEPTRLSAALMDDLALTATRAAAHVLAGEPRIALAAFVATAVTYGSALRIDHKGRGEGPDLPWPVRSYEHRNLSFGEAFRTAIAWDEDALQKQVARAIAHSLDFTSKAIIGGSYDTLQPAAVTDLRCALPVDAHRAALVQAFDPAAYFTAAPKAEAIAAIAECGDEPGKYAKLKKGDLIAVATRLASAHNWLPPLLRGQVFAAIDTLPEPEDTPEPEAAADTLPPAEQHQSAAEAAQAIWQDQERERLEELKTADLRKELKARGITAPFGSTHAAMVQLALTQPADEAEAA